MKDFAPEYPRDEHGWVLFPSDSDYRKDIFPPETNQHTAKANVFLVQSIVEFVSEPGQTLMDINAGTGTLMVAALISRRVICIEISPKFAELIRRGAEAIDKIASGAGQQITVINLPCQTALPIPGAADHIIFSPPYAGIMRSKGTDKLTREKTDYDMSEYTFTHPLNLGLMDDWLWGQEMEKVYKKCYDTLKPGGTLSVIVKDHMEKNQKTGVRERIQLSRAAQLACKRVGFADYAWFKWKAPGSVYTHIYRARGWEVVDDEDIVIMRKEDKIHLG